MKKGKRICNMLKAVRQIIACQNGIAYNARECGFNGECTGTCPTCEAEVKYLEKQLSARKKSGLPVKLTGIALSLCASPSASIQAQNFTGTKPHDIRQQDSCIKTVDLSQGCNDTVNIKGVITTTDNTPLACTPIIVLNPDSTSTRLTTYTNANGEYSIIVPRQSLLEISYIGLDKQILSATELKNNSHVILDDTQSLPGETVVVTKKPDGDTTHVRADFMPTSNE